MPVEIRELVINASLTEEAGKDNGVSILLKEDKEELNNKIKALERKIEMQGKMLERKIAKECLAEVQEMLLERERNLR